jgi:hypothetical protein
MGKAKKTRKFAEVKRMLNPKDAMYVLFGRGSSKSSSCSVNLSLGILQATKGEAATKAG